MNVRALRRLRSRLAANEAVVGLWVTLESASITEMAVALGVDWVVIDAEHGHLGWKDLLEHVRAAARSDTVALVRIAERSTSLAKRVLDIGADGVVAPLIESPEALRELLRDCRYPPAGRRGIGGERATVWGQCFREHAAEADEHVLAVPIVESVRGLACIDALLEVPGVPIFLFGPADLSASAGHAGEWEGPGVAEGIARAKNAILRAGRQCGILTRDPEDFAARHEQGFRFLGLGSDAGLMIRSLREMLRTAGRDRHPATSLDPADGTAIRSLPPKPTT